MTPDARFARSGLIGLAVVTALEIALSVVSRWIWAQVESGADFETHRSLLDALGYLNVFIDVAVAAILFVVARVPRATGARPAAIAAAVIASVTALIDIVYRLVLFKLGGDLPIGTMESVGKALGVLSIAGYLAGALLWAIVVARVGRAGAARWSTGAAFALVALAVLLTAANALAVVGVDTSAIRIPWAVVYYISAALRLAVAIGLAGAVVRVGEHAPAPETDRGAIDLAWQPVATGIAIYLGAVVVRIVLAVVGFALMRGASPQTQSELDAIASNVTMLALLSGGVGVAMLAGMFQIGRAPDETDASGPAHAALVLAGIAMVIDAVSAIITVKAMSELSVAFMAQDVLPALAGLGMTVSAGAGAALLSSFGRSASSLGRADLADGARVTRTVLVIAGVAAGSLFLLARWMPSALFLVAGVVILPLALYAGVRFLIIADALRREIRSRTDPR